ncbi:MAG: hypothetical protein AAGG00_05500 [Cyanobacteria bacterium P01_H01_bin.150]
MSPDKRGVATIFAVHFTLYTRSHNRKAGVVIFPHESMWNGNIPTAAAFINVVMTRNL